MDLTHLIYTPQIWMHIHMQTGIIIKEEVMTLRGSGGYKRSWRKKSVEWKLGKYRRFLQIIKKK